MEKVIEQFYSSFQQLDAEAMVACYHKDVVFEDPAFGVLKGPRAGNMWRMLCQSQKGKGFKLEYSDVQQIGEKGTAHWEARYTFSKTGRKVHNIIEAEFEFKDGLIIKHTDRFDLYGWAKQAMGITGVLIGWTGFFKKKFNAQANAALAAFEQKNKLVQ